MKKTPLILGIIFLHFNSFAQNKSGFYSPPKNHQQCISPVQHKAIEKKLKESQAALIKEGKLQITNPKSVMTTTFIWPVVQTNGLNDYGVHFISNFVDQDTTYPNHLLDYNCGNRTYDLADGYNHSGTDIALWPFWWYKMDSSQVKIIAGAAGTIIYKNDGNFDHNCNPPTTADWNAVYVQHADGSVAWYGHMKNGSLTNKAVGQTVAAGEYLGLVGSSGYSTGPHLHFEVYDPNNHLIDPFSGNCNSLNSNSWWVNQRPYYDSGINALRTQSDTVVFPNCPQQEIPNEQTYFCSGQDIYFSDYYRDQQAGQTSQYKVFRPDNSIWQQWSNTNTAYYNASYWYWNYTLPSAAPSGTWKFQVIYNGQTYERFFQVEVIPTISVAGSALVCSIAGVSYQWVNCNTGNSPIAGATYQSYTPTSNGSYAVIVTQNNCSHTSTCYNVSSAGITANALADGINIYPNPFTSETTIYFSEEQKQKVVKILDVLGKEMKTINFSGTKLIIEKGTMKKGVYFVQIMNENKSVLSKKINVE